MISDVALYDIIESARICNMTNQRRSVPTCYCHEIEILISKMAHSWKGDDTFLGCVSNNI